MAEEKPNLRTNRPSEEQDSISALRAKVAALQAQLQSRDEKAAAVEKLVCDICYEEVEEQFSISCNSNHKFCDECISQIVKDHAESVAQNMGGCQCPAPGCMRKPARRESRRCRACARPARPRRLANRTQRLAPPCRHTQLAVCLLQITIVDSQYDLEVTIWSRCTRAPHP